MTQRKIIAQGAEAIVFKEKNHVMKERISKSYRYPALDLHLRKTRTKREATVYKHLAGTTFVPKLLSCVNEQLMFEDVSGTPLAEHLEQLNYISIGKEMGTIVRSMHDHGIIHGDLTTSNFLYTPTQLFIIDFGLSFFSKKIEDQAVDLHLLKQALVSKHYTIWEACFDAVVRGYSNDLVVKRLNDVGLRGRNKAKI